MYRMDFSIGCGLLGLVGEGTVFFGDKFNDSSLLDGVVGENYFFSCENCISFSCFCGMRVWNVTCMDWEMFVLRC